MTQRSWIRSYFVLVKLFGIKSTFKNFVLEALAFVLRNNNCKFDKIFCNQTEGTTMGIKCVPPYACLVVGYKNEK